MCLNGLRLGILGGSFDPIHNVHLELGKAAAHEFDIDRVIFIPAGQPYFKMRDGRKISDSHDRLEMVRLAVSDNPKFLCSDIEVRREGPTYTSDTLKELKAAYPTACLFLIMGADSLVKLDTWYRPDEIFSRATIISANRNHQVPEAELLRTEAFLREKYDARILHMQFRYTPVSSSGIRDGHVSVAQCPDIPQKVREYITRKGLYAGWK